MVLDYRLAAIKDAIIEYWEEIGLETYEAEGALVVRVRGSAETGKEEDKTSQVLSAVE